jgi:TfoX/Sxy family transcriptional regulator of competence genes
MAYDEKIASRVREALADAAKVTEKKMFGGIAFMVNDKMCVGVDKEDLMIRCDPADNDKLLSKKGVRQFDLTGKPMKGWLLVSPEATRSKKEFDWWIQFALESNKKVAAKKKK